MNQKMVLVSGASGTLGRAYLEHYQGESGVRCIGIARRDVSIPNVSILKADLLGTAETAAAINRLSFEGVEEVVLIHPVGMFKFEEDGKPAVDLDGDGVDDEVLASNIATLDNILNPLREKIASTGKHIPLTLCAFGSLSDSYAVKYWKSYSRAKNMLRSHMRKLSSDRENEIRCVFFTVSTVNAEKERELRPFADAQYWLATEELVARSVPHIDQAKSWEEVDIFNPMPGFKPEYYSDHDAVRTRWSREMGRKLR